MQRAWRGHRVHRVGRGSAPGATKVGARTPDGPRPARAAACRRCLRCRGARRRERPGGVGPQRGTALDARVPGPRAGRHGVHHGRRHRRAVVRGSYQGVAAGGLAAVTGRAHRRPGWRRRWPLALALARRSGAAWPGRTPPPGSPCSPWRCAGATAGSSSPRRSRGPAASCPPPSSASPRPAGSGSPPPCTASPWPVVRTSAAAGPCSPACADGRAGRGRAAPARHQRAWPSAPGSRRRCTTSSRTRSRWSPSRRAASR